MSLGRERYWVSCSAATGQVDIDSDGIIVSAPPVWGKFIGQPATNLGGWLRKKFGKIEIVNLKSVELPPVN